MFNIQIELVSSTDDRLDDLANQPYYDEGDEDDDDPVDAFNPANEESSDDADPVII